MRAGDGDIARAANDLASRLPEGLAPMAELAYNYWWSWAEGGTDLFASLDPHRWEHVARNPIRLLLEASHEVLDRNAAGPIAERAAALRDRMRAELARPVAAGDAARPVAFMCTEFAIHGSLPIYAGGLGVLAGDILKESSDRAYPVVGVGLLYRQGYFRQRFDRSGWQHEYWTQTDPHLLPAVEVRGADGEPLTVAVDVWGTRVTASIWRVDAGRVPLYLLDAEHPDNDPVARWITSRLYIGDRRFRLAQYALLGVGGIRALRALGIDPSVVHLNEGHVAFAPLELAREALEAGGSFEDAVAQARARTVFTTHTPVAAGNESYTGGEVASVLADLAERAGEKELLGLGREDPTHAEEPFGLTPLGLRVSRAANAVSRRHGEVARGMWRHLYPDRQDVPIGHVTNGVHLPTWLAPPMRALLDRHLGEGWLERADDDATWKAVEAVPDEELWDVRNALRADLIAYARERAAADRLAREEPVESAEAVARSFDPGVLTIGFARRAAMYKRLFLLTLDPERLARLLGGATPVQLLIAGKPHPRDEEAKRMVQEVFDVKRGRLGDQRIAYLEDYDMAMARKLVAGCDVWVNVPRPPMEASGTSGMKAGANGCVNLSVADGWWEEGYDGTNGWSITSHPDGHAQDIQDANALYELLERTVVPMFHQRGDDGVPHEWLAVVKRSIATVGPRFSATRMMREYASIYGL